MDRFQFCQQLREIRDIQKIPNYELAYHIKKSDQVVNNLLNSESDYRIDAYLPLITGLSVVLTLSKDNRNIQFTDLVTVKEFVRDFLYAEGNTEKSLTEKLNISKDTVNRLRHGGTIRLSVFLKIAELAGYTVNLEIKAD